MGDPLRDRALMQQAREEASRWVDGCPVDDPRLAAIAPHLAEVRATGFRIGPSRQLAGVVDLSAPILGPDGDAVAVLTSAWIQPPGDGPDAPRATALSRLCAVAAALSFPGPGTDRPG